MQAGRKKDRCMPCMQARRVNINELSTGVIVISTTFLPLARHHSIVIVLNTSSGS